MYNNLVGICPRKTNMNGYPVTILNLVLVKYGYQTWNYVLSKSNITYEEYESSFDTKYSLVKHNDYIDMFFNLFLNSKPNLSVMEEYFLVKIDHEYFAYNFKQRHIKDIDQNLVNKFLSSNTKTYN